MRHRLAPIAGAAAGPILIVTATLIALRDFVAHALLPVGDVLTLWLPTYCLLGRSLAAGHVPGWNAHIMAGIPFAADPQSGWMNLAAMALFTSMPCGAAIRVYAILQPILGGLGVFLFLRSEGLQRPAATVGGVVLGVGMAGSEVATALPFSASLAWTAVMLAAASRFARSDRAGGRLGWGLLVAIAWGQAATALMSEGLIIATGALLAYAVASIARSTARAPAFRRWGLVVASLVPVNLAALLPRLAYLPRTTLGLGYARLDELNAVLAGQPTVHSGFGGASPAWPLDLAIPPGLALPAMALVLALAALWQRWHRQLVVGLVAVGGLAYLASLGAVARAVASWFPWRRVTGAYLHAPARLGLTVALVIALLAPLGIEGFLDASPNRRGAILLPGLMAWGVIPLVLGAPALAMVPFAVGLIAGALTLTAASRHPRLLAAIPVVLAAELLVHGSLATALARTGPPGFDPRPPNTGPPPPPTAEIDRYLRGGPIGRALDGEGRYLLVGEGARQELSQPIGNGAFNEAMVLGAQNAGGYDSVQLQRYWMFVRAVQRRSIIYNRASFLTVPPVATDLLQIRSVVAPADMPVPRGRPLARQGGWVLFELPIATPRVSAVRSWTVVDGPDGALAAVRAPGFDPEETVVLERRPGFPTSAGAQAPLPTVSIEARGSQQLTVSVRSATPVILVIRNSFDPNWRATIDRAPAPVLAADFVVQGVAVPAGTHVVDLTYDDPWIGWGLAGSALAVAGIPIAAGLIQRRDRRTLGQDRPNRSLRGWDSNPQPSA